MQIKDIFETCAEIHHRVLKGFRYRTDEQMHSLIEHWQAPTDVDRVIDDCDGFAIACRGLVREQGLESRLVLCLTETGEGHLVCGVGNYILDNRQRRVVTRENLERDGYKFLYVSGLEPGDTWFRLEG
jgi:predicted transglutaminase-like cysteine proteinase